MFDAGAFGRREEIAVERNRKKAFPRILRYGCIVEREPLTGPLEGNERSRVERQSRHCERIASISSCVNLTPDRRT